MLTALVLLASAGTAIPVQDGDSRTIVLIDVDENRVVEDGVVASARNVVSGASWSVRKDRLRGGKQDGVDLITIDNGALQVRLVPTRGMSVLDVRRGDLRLGWDSPSQEIVHPKLIDLESRGGLGWLEGFNEWLVRCGLEFAGHPGEDRFTNNTGDEATLDLTLHGRIGNLPARRVELEIESKAPYRIHLRGVVDERVFYGPRLRLVTDFSLVPGETAWRITDTVTNLGGSEQEFQVIYHTNFGTPLLEEGSVLVMPAHTVTPMNEHAATGIDAHPVYEGPTLGFVEQVYLVEPYCERDGRTEVLLHDRAGEHAATISWNVDDLPYFTQWKNTAAEADGYVTGLEPGTGFPFNRRVEREHGRVPRLAAGASRTFTLDFALLEGAEAVQAGVERVRAIQGTRETERRLTPPDSN